MPYYRLFYHFIWSTKDRLPFLVMPNRGAIYHAIETKVEDLNGIAHALNGMEDHVHLLVTVPPAQALSSFIGQIKGHSSFVASRLPGLEGSFAWQSEYGVLSVSEANAPMIVNYIRMQQKHHAEYTLNPALENWG